MHDGFIEQCFSQQFFHQTEYQACRKRIRTSFYVLKRKITVRVAKSSVMGIPINRIIPENHRSTSSRTHPIEHGNRFFFFLPILHQPKIRPLDPLSPIRIWNPGALANQKTVPVRFLHQQLQIFRADDAKCGIEKKIITRVKNTGDNFVVFQELFGTGRRRGGTEMDTIGIIYRGLGSRSTHQEGSGILDWDSVYVNMASMQCRALSITSGTKSTSSPGLGLSSTRKIPSKVFDFM